MNLAETVEKRVGRKTLYNEPTSNVLDNAAKQPFAFLSRYTCTNVPAPSISCHAACSHLTTLVISVRLWHEKPASTLPKVRKIKKKPHCCMRFHARKCWVQGLYLHLRADFQPKYRSPTSDMQRLANCRQRTLTLFMRVSNNSPDQVSD